MLGWAAYESPCRIEPSLPLPQRASFASRVSPPRLWHIEEDIARAVFALAPIMAASTVVVCIGVEYIATGYIVAGYIAAEHLRALIA